MMTKELLSPVQVGRTDVYLRTFRHSTSSAAQLQAIFARCCMAGAKLPMDERLLESDLSHYVAALCAHPDPTALNLDPMLVLEAHRILVARQDQTSGIEPLIGTIATELKAQTGDTCRLGRVRLMAEHLRGFGFDLPRFRPGRDAVKLLKTTDAWLSAPLPALDDMLDHLAADHEELSPTQISLLSLIALAELRNYHVDIGSKVIRLLLKQGPVNEEISEALLYMMLQRRNDGAYGFPSPFDEQNWDRSVMDLRICLPLTLNVMWALYEACIQGALSFASEEVAA